jgi:hypothetical protein
MNGEKDVKITYIHPETQSLERRDTRQEHEPGSKFFVTCLLFQKVFNFGPLCAVQLVITNVSLRYNLWYVVKYSSHKPLQFSHISIF